MTVIDLGAVRRRVGASVFARVAGPEGPQHRARIHDADGPRWFADDRPIREVHGDASMFVGGLRALLLQSLHPLAMAGVAGHSDYRGDPWGRLQRTSYFLAVTTYGRAEDAEKAVARVRGVHRRVKGTAPDGRAYAAGDPRLLEWVHVAEADSFLAAHDRYGRNPLSETERDGYVADLAVVGRKLGVLDPPTTARELSERIEGFRPELASTDDAVAAARFLVFRPPLPLAVRPAYGVLAAAGVSLLPGWARRPLKLPRLPLTETALVRPAGDLLVRSIRWAMSPPADEVRTSRTA